jgi:hypothetical protein
MKVSANSSEKLNSRFLNYVFREALKITILKRGFVTFFSRTVHTISLKFSMESFLDELYLIYNFRLQIMHP